MQRVSAGQWVAHAISGADSVVRKYDEPECYDADGDGEADVFECVSDAWGYTGNYHSFATGPLVDERGLLGALITGHRAMTNVPAMGWCLKISPHPDNTGAVPFTDLWRTDPFCSGLRVPNGFGEFRGDLFMTDNQGHWVAANKLNHLQFTNYYGHPSAPPRSRRGNEADSPERPHIRLVTSVATGGAVAARVQNFTVACAATSCSPCWSGPFW